MPGTFFSLGGMRSSPTHPLKGWREFLPRRRTADITVDALLDDWRAHLERTGSRSLRDKSSAIETKLRPAFGQLTAAEFADLGPSCVEAYAAWLAHQGKAPKTIRKEVSFLSSFCEFGINSQALPENPVRKVRRGALPANSPADPGRAANEVLTARELGLVLYCPQIPWVRRRLWALMALAGLRFGEAAAATWGQLSLDRRPLGELLIDRSWDCRDHRVSAETKTSLVRRVPVAPLLERMLRLSRRWDEGELGRAVRPEDLLAPFVDTEGRRTHWHQSTALRRWHEDLLSAGVSPTHRPRRIHSLRHTFASLLRRAGADREAVRQITHIGEAPDDAFALYEHLDWATLCRAVAALEIGNERARREATP